MEIWPGECLTCGAGHYRHGHADWCWTADPTQPNLSDVHMRPVVPGLTGGYWEPDREGPPPKLECRWGHPWWGDNLYVSPKGAKRCRTCRREARARRRGQDQG